MEVLFNHPLFFSFRPNLPYPKFDLPFRMFIGDAIVTLALDIIFFFAELHKTIYANVVLTYV